MAIYYSPYPNVSQPITTAPYSTATNDIYVTSVSSAKKLIKTIGLVWSGYTPSTADNGFVTPNIPGLIANAVPTIPALIANAVSPTINATQNQSINVSPITVYGGSAVATNYTALGNFVGYTTAITPALPTGVSWTSTFATFRLQNTLDGKYYLYNSATITVSGTPTVVLAPTNYTVSFTDASGLTANASFSLKVNSNLNPLTVTSAVVGNQILTQGVSSGATGFPTVTVVGGTSPLKYSISPTLPSGLTFNAGTGNITGTPAVTLASTAFTVTITDSSSPTPQTDSSIFNLAILANIPTVTLAVPTTVLTQGVIFTAFAPVTGTGGTAPLRYAVVPELPAGLIFSTSTGVISGTATAAVAASNYTVTVTDSLQQSASQAFNLTVKAIPVLTAIQAQPNYLLSRAVAASAFTPIAANGGYGTISYSLTPALPAGLTFSTSTGVIIGTPTGASSTATYTVNLADQAAQTASGTFTLAVLTIPINVTQQVASTLLTKNVAATAFTPVTASGGYAPYTYGVVPALPTGLSFNTTSGSISGTATATSPATSYVVTITDSSSQSATSNFSLTVLQPPAIILTKAISATTLVQGTAATSFTPISATGGYGTLSYAVSPTLTAGLTINASTGQITGTPSTYSVNTTTYTVSVTDQATQISLSTFDMNVLTTPFIVTAAVPSNSLLTSVAITAFTPVTAAGGATPYTYGLNTPISTGLTFSTSTGLVSGTATTANATSYIVTITDNVRQSGTGTFTLNITNPPALVLTTAVPSTTLVKSVDNANFIPVTAAGGYGSIILSVYPTLPTGLTFSNIGKVTGIPTQASTQTTYTVKGVDSIGQISSSTFYITVNNPTLTATVVIGISTLTQYTAATPYTPVTYVGGTPPVTYSVAPSLPNGLSLNASTGVISGTPATAVSTTPYNITITDSIGGNTTGTTRITVLAIPDLVSTRAVSPITAFAGQSLTAVTPITASGGYGTFSYAVTPTLPSGLLFSSVDGKITGTPTKLSATATYTVTVSDPVNQTTSTNFDLVVAAQPVVATQSIPASTFLLYQQITPFTPVVGSGGFGNLAYAVNISLPAGLNLNASTGQIAGTPTAVSATATYIITVTDSVTQSSTSSFSLSVGSVAPNPLLVTVTSPSVQLVQNQPANVNPVQVVSGVSPYVYSLTPALPPGLSFDIVTGAITGTPNSITGATTYNITVTDTQPQSITKSFSLSITVGTVIINGNVNQITNNANSTSTTSGALIVAGGVGIGQDAYIGGNLYVNGVVNANVTGIATTATNIANGSTGQFVYQTAPGSTGFVNTSAMQVGYATTASYSANVLGGAVGSLVYQSSANTTGMLAIGTNGYVLTSNGLTPTWTALAGLSAGSATTATNIANGSAGQFIYQIAPGSTGFVNTSAMQVGYATTSGYAATFNTSTLVSTSVNFLNTASTQVGYATTAGYAVLFNTGTLVATSVNFLNTANTQVGFASTATNISSGSAGQLVYQTAPGSTGFVDTDTAGNVLVSNGTGAPVYQNTLALSGTQTSTSTNTGALTVVGGVGVGGGLYVGGGITTNKTADLNDAIVEYNAAINGTLTIYGNQQTVTVLSYNGVSFLSNEIHGFVGGETFAPQTSNLGLTQGVTYYVVAVLSPTRFILSTTATGSGVGTVGTATVVGDFRNSPALKVTGAAHISTSTASTSTTTGALVVDGGVGIGGDVVIGGNVAIGGDVAIAGNVTGGGIRTYSGSTPPAIATVGDIWYNTNNDAMYRFTDDGATNQYWIDITGPLVAYVGLT